MGEKIDTLKNKLSLDLSLGISQVGEVSKIPGIQVCM